MRKKIFVISGSIALGLLIVIWTIDFTKKSISKIDVYGTAPKFSALTQDSITIHTNELFQKKITVFSHIFTHCPTICPKMSERVFQLSEIFKNDKDKVQFVSLSVDPLNDTPSKLKKYKEKFAPNSNWILLNVPDIDKIKQISELGFLLPAGNLPAMHSTKFILIDQDGLIRGYYSSTEEASIRTLKSNIREIFLQGK